MNDKLSQYVDNADKKTIPPPPAFDSKYLPKFYKSSEQSLPRAVKKDKQSNLISFDSFPEGPNERNAQSSKLQHLRKSADEVAIKSELPASSSQLVKSYSKSQLKKQPSQKALYQNEMQKKPYQIILDYNLNPRYRDPLYPRQEKKIQRYDVSKKPNYSLLGPMYYRERPSIEQPQPSYQPASRRPYAYPRQQFQHRQSNRDYPKDYQKETKVDYQRQYTYRQANQPSKYYSNGCTAGASKHNYKFTQASTHRLGNYRRPQIQQFNSSFGDEWSRFRARNRSIERLYR